MAEAKQVIYLRLSPELYEAVDRQADRLEQNKTMVISGLIQKYLIDKEKSLENMARLKKKIQKASRTYDENFSEEEKLEHRLTGSED